MSTVYLAGPIAGCNRGEANNWRHDVMAKLRPYGIFGVSPLRCEPLIGERYGMGCDDPRFGTARAIASKNFFDVQSCDFTLCYMPQEINERRLSLGTIIELAWAHSLRKPTLLVTQDPLLLEHAVVQANASWILGTLDEAVEGEAEPEEEEQPEPPKPAPKKAVAPKPPLPGRPAPGKSPAPSKAPAAKMPAKAPPAKVPAKAPVKAGTPVKSVPGKKAPPPVKR